MLSNALHARFADTADQRVSDRRVLRLEAQVATPAGEGDIAVHNLSRTGMLVECDAAVAVGSQIEIELPGGTNHSAAVVWSDEGLFGCRFAQALTQAQLSAALLRSAPPPVEAASPQALSQEAAMELLRQHWKDEEEEAPVDDRKLPLSTRMWIIAGLGLTGWAVPAAAAWMLF